MSPQNRLAQETSPYLKQHAGNPVDWWPWSDAAFEEARQREVPVLLSVGYSSCHWCHVMAHESFEDDATAEVMNQLFVNVKVDREERPDVDAVYMEAVQAMTGRGGWPMTVMLTPDGEPFFAGTYFPPERRHNMPAFVEVLHAVEDAWRNRRDEVVQQASEIAAAIRSRTSLPAPQSVDQAGVADVSIVDAAAAALVQAHDPQWGGFGSAPKFPQPSMLDLLLRVYLRTGRPEMLSAITTTLDAMASGGIYDHLGGGFSRYSVDDRWLVPHFEKMLYDQAGLARVYLHAWQATGNDRWYQVLDETISYVLRDLRQSGAGFSSAEDADSEGVEGKFYVWSAAEVIEVLGPTAAGPAMAWYGVTETGNFEGSNILHRPTRGDLARPVEIEAARRALLEARGARVRPGLDDKVLTEWNAMFVSVLAEAGAATGRTDWIDAAAETAEFLLAELRDAEGRWLRSWQGGQAKHLAYAADHAWLIDAFTRLGEATGLRRWTDEAVETARSTVLRFWDHTSAGLFTTAHDAERLIVRSKELTDGATPAANSVAATAFLRLGTLTGDDDMTLRSEDILTLLGPLLTEYPAGFTHALAAVDLLAAGATEVVVPGHDDKSEELVRAAQRPLLPNAVFAWGEPYDSPLWEGREPGLAYVCRNYACQKPVSDVDELLTQLI